MKLDSIVYDYGTLQTAIADSLNAESSTFKAIYPSDTATSLVNVLASYGSMLQYQLVSSMANMYMDSAFSEAGIYQLAETLGNRLHGNISSQVYCNITRTNLKGISNIIIPAGSTFKVEDLLFFNPDSIVFPLEINSLYNVKLVQGTLQTVEQYSSGISGEKIYFCDDFRCNTNMVKVFVNGVQWEITDSFLPYVVTDTSIAAETQVVIVKTDADGRTYVKFGNNTNGLIPPTNSTIRIEYVTNEGANGNLNNNELDIQLTTPIYYTNSQNTREQLTVDITAITTASGGFNTQSIETLRESSPYTFASGQRAIRRNDYKTMLLNHCGYLTTNVWGEYEEAAIQGGYDKIMMNMVYYTGIKSIQKYDLQPVKLIEISPTEINYSTSAVYSVEGNINSARGFLGSYIIDISSFDSDGLPISVKYRDNDGTGILVCDPSVNSNLVNFESQIYPLNDLITDTVAIDTNQKLVESSNNPALLNMEGKEFISSGVTEDEQPSLITFDNPFQIKLDFQKKISITGFAFKSPSTSENYRKFMHQFAIYGTNEDNASYDNVKNNTKWQKLTGMHIFDTDIALNSFSDWVTTNVYSPGTAIEENEDLSEQCADTPQSVFVISPSLLEEEYSYSVKVNQEMKPANEYSIDKDAGTLTFATPVPMGSNVILYGTLYDWARYKHYLIEVYTIKDSSIKSPRVVALNQIKAIYKESSSTINYTKNNAINLNLPIVSASNVVEAYTIPGIPQLSSGWLADKNGNLITPDIGKIYHVHDSNTFNTTVRIRTAGSGFTVGDKLNLQYYFYTIQRYAENNGSNYLVGETFKLNGKDAIITEVDAFGGAKSAEFIGLNKYGSDNMASASNISMDPGSYIGHGTGAKFDVYSTKTPQIYVEDGSAIIAKVKTVNGSGGITALDTTSYITAYDATNTTAISSIKSDNTTTNAYFNATSVLNTTLYNDKVFLFRDGAYVENDTILTKELGLPESMQYYEYDVKISGLTEENQYRTGNIVQYSTIIDNTTYIFQIQIINITSKDYLISLATDTTYPSYILRGKSGIKVSGGDLTNIVGSGSGGKITITSTSTVNVYGSYTGNFYSNTDIQAFDLPIINKYNHFTTYLEFKQPHIKNIKIELNVEYENIVTYQEVKNNIITAVNQMFDLKPFSIGSTLNVSDIWKTVNNIKGIKRFNVITPSDNITCLPYELLTLPAENLIINDILNNEYK